MARLDLKDYAKSLSDDDLRTLNSRYSYVSFGHQYLQMGDRADIANVLSRNEEMDAWLKSAESADEWFDMIDQVGSFVVKESKRRSNPGKDYSAEKSFRRKDRETE